jgi:hypothetical protein
MSHLNIFYISAVKKRMASMILAKYMKLKINIRSYYINFNANCYYTPVFASLLNSNQTSHILNEYLEWALYNLWRDVCIPNVVWPCLKIYVSWNIDVSNKCSFPKVYLFHFPPLSNSAMSLINVITLLYALNICIDSYLKKIWHCLIYMHTIRGDCPQ